MMATLAADIVSNCCQDAPETKRYALATLQLQFSRSSVPAARSSEHSAVGQFAYRVTIVRTRREQLLQFSASQKASA
jgi:hypothetical protein